MKCPHCKKEIGKLDSDDEGNLWLYIPELRIEIQKDVHHKDYSYDKLKEIYGKGFEKMLLTKNQVEFLRDHSEYSKIFKLKTWNNDFYIQQFDEDNKKRGYVAGFYSYRYWSGFGSYWGSNDSNDFRGVRFCRKKLSKGISMKIILTEKELMNIVSTHNEEDIKMLSSGEYNKWKIEKHYYDNGLGECYELEYLFDQKGNLKDKSVKNKPKNESKLQKLTNEDPISKSDHDKIGSIVKKDYEVKK